jgi:epoxyqueuosine reductase QueG
MFLNNKIIEILKQENCDIVGFADLHCISNEARQGFDYGIIMALSYTKEAMQDNKNELPQKYYSELEIINKRLPELAVLTADFLVSNGYKALPKTQSMIVLDKDWRSILPHKTVATLAGMGWIGKCANLVTNEIGSALRFIVVLTNAPLDCGEPISKSLCPPNCNVCADVCPGKAPLGGLWEANIDRDDFFYANACSKAARVRAKEKLDIDMIVCGLCISNCPFTQRGLGYS